MPPDFKTTWRAILAKLTLDEKLVLNQFLRAHRDALQQNENQKTLLASERALAERLIARRKKSDSDTDISPARGTALDGVKPSVQ